MASLVGTSVGDYLITDYVGSGATAEVYAAVGSESARKVAVKVMRPVSSVGQAEHFAQRFTIEVDVLRGLVGCPYVVQVRESGRLNGKTPYYVMDFVEGRTLEDEMAEHGRFSLSEAFPIVRQLCMALQMLHSRRIVHRDLKPANVILREGPSPNVVLLDFGIAKQLDTQRNLTVGAMGSPIFAAPEQVRNGMKLVGPYTDIYALGVVAYIMLAAQDPFDISSDEDALSVMMMRLEREPVPLHERTPWIPIPLARVIDSCLAVQPSDRPASTGVLLSHFARALETDPLHGLDCADCSRKATCPLIPLPEGMIPFADTVLGVGPAASSR